MRNRRESAADAAIADDAEAAAGKLPSHHDLRLPPGMVIRRRPRNPARQVDQVAERQFSDGCHEAGSGAGDQHAGRGRGIDVDIADIDRAANEGAQFRQPRKNLAGPFRQAVGDDDVDVPRRVDQAGGIQRVVGFMQHHLRHGLQAVQAALAVILAPHLRRMGQQDFHGTALPARQ